MFLRLFLSLLAITVVCSSSINIYFEDQNDSLKYDDACTKPLLLTPYIEAGNISEAQDLARVHPLDHAGNIQSYSGYLTVNETCNSNIFFWFFPSENNYEIAPLTLWLQGGPGESSLIGLFEEIGPFYVNHKNVIQARNYSWSSISSLLFIDNPVGAGYSFTNNDECYVNNQDGVRKDMYNALIQFFKLFPNLQKNEFYIFGESYAGKYVPAVAYTIHEKNPISELKINLKGLGIGGGVCDLASMLEYSEYVYQLGLVDELGKKEIHEMQREAVELINTKQWEKASYLFADIINKIKYLSHNVSIYNYAKMYNDIVDSPLLQKYVTNNTTRCAIHVGNVPYYIFNRNVSAFLLPDVTKSVKSWVEILLENYPILFYNGQFDIIVGYPLTRSFVNGLSWSGADEFKTKRQLPFYDRSGKEVVCGYIKRFKHLNLALVRNAGHMVSEDQPECAYELYKRFLFNRENITSYDYKQSF